MSTEKLSELSKPVAWTDERGNLCTNRNKERGLESRYHQDYEKYTTPFYSQEYVSALLAELETSQKALKGVTELWNDQRQRIAELEAIRADTSLVFKEIGNELGCNPDNESIMMAIDALNERLATSARLPTKYSMLHREDFHGDYQSKMVFKADEVIAALRAHGFTVEGDE